MRTRRSELDGPGITRRRRGRGFSYLMPDGTAAAPDVRDRCHRLAIPPAWRDVWICPFPTGHIQAVGTDAAGRRQYLYHEAWHERMAREKFDRMLDLAEAIPAARRGVTADLRTTGFTRRRVLAGAFRMLDSALLRVGSEAYAREHGSVGLATLLGRHVAVRRGRVVELRFPGKSGQLWASEIDDADLAVLIGGLRHRGPDARVLAWRDDGTGDWHELSPGEINDDVRRRAGGDFTAKDFRTLHGTIVAARSLAEDADAWSNSRRRDRAIAAAVRSAAAALGNTPSVARSSYIDPRLFDAFAAGRTIATDRRPEGLLHDLLE